MRAKALKELAIKVSRQVLSNYRFKLNVNLDSFVLKHDKGYWGVAFPFYDYGRYGEIGVTAILRIKGVEKIVDSIFSIPEPVDSYTFSYAVPMNYFTSENVIPISNADDVNRFGYYFESLFSTQLLPFFE